MHCAERFLLQAPGEVLCAHRPAQPESHFTERETEALRLGDAFEATPQKDGKAEFLTQDSRTPRPTPLWGHSTTIQSFHHRHCARLPTGVVSVSETMQPKDVSGTTRVLLRLGTPQPLSPSPGTTHSGISSGFHCPGQPSASFLTHL